MQREPARHLGLRRALLQVQEGEVARDLGVERVGAEGLGLQGDRLGEVAAFAVRHQRRVVERARAARPRSRPAAAASPRASRAPQRGRCRGAGTRPIRRRPRARGARWRSAATATAGRRSRCHASARATSSSFTGGAPAAAAWARWRRRGRRRARSDAVGTSALPSVRRPRGAAARRAGDGRSARSDERRHLEARLLLAAEPPADGDGSDDGGCRTPRAARVGAARRRDRACNGRRARGDGTPAAPARSRSARASRARPRSARPPGPLRRWRRAVDVGLRRPTPGAGADDGDASTASPWPLSGATSGAGADDAGRRKAVASPAASSGAGGPGGGGGGSARRVGGVASGRERLASLGVEAGAGVERGRELGVAQALGGQRDQLVVRPVRRHGARRAGRADAGRTRSPRDGARCVQPDDGSSSSSGR